MASPPPADVPVAIVGAGPVGLALALGLARHGVRSVVLERHRQLSRHSKAAGLHVRTREVLRRWGAEEPLLAAGNLVEDIRLHDVGTGRELLHLDVGLLADEAARPGMLVLEQSETERLLLEAVRASGLAEVAFGTDVTGLHPRDDATEVRFDRDGTGGRLTAEYVVGCDGASSRVRDVLGLPFTGRTYRLRPLLADVTVADAARDGLPWPRLDDRADGLTVGIRLRPGLWRIIHLGASADGEEVPDAEVQQRAEAVLGPGPVDIVWRSRFRIHRRSSPRFRQGRVLLAGDAAHVHSPVGGQGMNAGIQDAADLAWKLAGALRGGDAERLLEAYDVERREVVVGGVTRFTDLLTRVYLMVPGRVRRGAFAVQRTAMRSRRLHRAALRRFAMLDLRLPPSPLLGEERGAGRRLPDPLVRAPDGTVRRLHDLLPVGAALLTVTSSHASSAEEALPVEAVVRIGPGGHQDGTGTLRSLLDGRDGWILVRPDGHVAWARTTDDGPTKLRLADAAAAALGLRGHPVGSGRRHAR